MTAACDHHRAAQELPADRYHRRNKQRYYVTTTAPLRSCPRGVAVRAVTY